MEFAGRSFSIVRLDRCSALASANLVTHHLSHVLSRLVQSSEWKRTTATFRTRLRSRSGSENATDVAQRPTDHLHSGFGLSRLASRLFENRQMVNGSILRSWRTRRNFSERPIDLLSLSLSLLAEFVHSNDDSVSAGESAAIDSSDRVAEGRR